MAFVFLTNTLLFSCSQGSHSIKDAESLKVGGVYVVDQSQIKFNDSQKRYTIIKILCVNEDTVCYRTFKNTFETEPSESWEEYDFRTDYVDGLGYKSIGTLSEKVDTRSFRRMFGHGPIVLVRQTELSAFDREVLGDH